MTEEVNSYWIAGFWKRIGALVVDSIILGIIGLVLGLFLESYFVQIGGWGRLIGLSIALIYFGTMNSSVCGGQSVGKKAFNIRVVDSKNSPISLIRSIARYLILGIPLTLNGARLSDDITTSFLIYPLNFVIFGGATSIFYLYIFNRLTRQSLHDLVVGSYVVNANSETPETRKTWRGHIVVTAILFIVAVALPALTMQITKIDSFDKLRKAQTALTNAPQVYYAAISYGSSTFSSSNKETKTTTYVNSQIFLAKNNIHDAKFARRLATTLIEAYPEALEKDSIQITLIYGYDIGIAEKWARNTHRFAPSDIISAE